MKKLLLICLIGLSSCNPAKDLTIPSEPTIWIVSEIYEPTKLEAKKFNGLIGYKMIPVNPGSINAKPVWVLDYTGKYYVGQRLDFAPLEKIDAPGPQK